MLELGHGAGRRGPGRIPAPQGPERVPKQAANGRPRPLAGRSDSPPCATCMRRRTIPSPALVDLLLERAGGEVQGLRPAVRDALSRIANGLDASARDPDATDRADAVGRPAPS